MENVEGKTAFITGGASGMGLGMAKAFLKAGMNVVIADVREDALKEAMAELGHSNRAYAVKLDVTDRDDWVRAADEAETHFGPVHVLVNNAGVGVLGKMQDASYKDWDFCMGVNLGGTINGVQTFVPRMIAHGQGGHIVNNSSQSGAFASGQAGIYITTKMAVAGMSEALASDLKEEGIGVSVYFPGPVRTNLGVTTNATRPERLKNEDEAARQAANAAARAKRPAVSADTFMSKEEVGERVLRGIQRGDLFIFSHPEFKAGMQARHDAIMRAVPDEPAPAERAEVLKHFGTLLYNPIYEDQQPVPGFEFKPE
jgi:NAD(P)-dependent dehydrogenase (short-subunit alcohol dehydrogenase family)